MEYRCNVLITIMHKVARFIFQWKFDFWIFLLTFGATMSRSLFFFSSSLKCLVLYEGFNPLALGSTQICKKWTQSLSDPLNSECEMPVPALVNWTSPRLMNSLLPMLSWWASMPLTTYEKISKFRCGCIPKPLVAKKLLIICPKIVQLFKQINYIARS